MRYLPIHVHSAFSFLYGAFTPQDLVAEVSRRVGNAVCLCDWSGLYGMVRLARAGQAAGISTLCGARVGLLAGGSLLLFPRDECGHAELCALLTRCHLENPRGRPAARLAWLGRLSSVAAVLPGGEVFGQSPWWPRQVGDAFSGPMFMGLPGPEVTPGQRDRLRRLAAELEMPCLAAPQVAALDSRSLRLHRALVAIARTIHHRRWAPLPDGAGVLPTDADMARWFSPQEIRATWDLLKLCPFELELGRRYLPDYPLPPGGDAQHELAARCLRALGRRSMVDKAHSARLLRELELIGGFGFAPYFLLVSDIVGFARQRNIRCTVRGSAAGSVVTWLLCGGVDPVEHDLLFERFLNQGRKEPPDVDLDFDSLRRDEVLRYLMQRFEGRAAMVATVPTFRARSAIRELCLASGGSPELAGQLTELIPHFARAARLPRLLKVTPELAGHPLARRPRLVELAAGIGGLPRQLSVHLGGVALGPLARLTPLELSAQNLPVIQLDKDDAQDLGLIKMDLLGLRMHSAIAQSITAMRARGATQDPDAAALDDPAVYDLLCSTHTVGIFQVESPGQRGMLGRLQPRNFHDLMVEISLFRPGPMQADMVTPYLRRRAGQEPVTYPHKCLEPVLAETLGVLVYQEQVLRICHQLAGMSYAQADGLRRAMTHRRSPGEMNRLRQGFLDGCASRQVAEDVALLLWDQVASFASYGFPKAHAAAFAHITYISTWLRAHYPLEFFLGLLNAGHVGSYPPRVLINEARRLGIGILPPTVNQSRELYLAEGQAIRVALTVVRGMGPKGVAKLLKARDRFGPFQHHEQLQSRAGLNRAQLKSLQTAGSLQGLTPMPGLFMEETGGELL